METNIGSSKKKSAVQRTGISRKQRGRPTSVCGVCGDEAKHIHFGGLCCPSCKAFFRRAVQLNLKDLFACSLIDKCEITVKNRRECPACRFKKCESIGMLFTWVMPEDERKKMMERRTVATKRILERLEDNDLASNNTNRKDKRIPERLEDIGLDSNTNEREDLDGFIKRVADAKAKSDPVPERRSNSQENVNCKLPEETTEAQRKSEYKIKIKEVVIKQEIKVEEEALEIVFVDVPEEIQNLSLHLSAAFVNSDFPQELSVDASEKFGQIFFSYCKTLSVFFSNIDDLNGLNHEENSKMIKHAVTRSIFLYSAHQFDSITDTFPRSKFNSQCSFPTIHLNDIEYFVGDKKIYSEIKSFLSTYSGALEDECIVLFLMIISFLKTDDSVSQTAVEMRTKYCQQFEDFLSQRQESNIYKDLQYYFNILSDVDKLAKEFGEMKLSAENSLPILETSIKINDEESSSSKSAPKVPKTDCEKNLKTVNLVRIDHDYSMSITMEEPNFTSKQKSVQAVCKNKNGNAAIKHSFCREKLPHPFYQKTFKSSTRHCCSEVNPYRSIPSQHTEAPEHHLEFKKTFSPEYTRHSAFHTANHESMHHLSDHAFCSSSSAKEYLPPSHLSSMAEDHGRLPYQCCRKYQCYPPRHSPYQRCEPLRSKCAISPPRWSHYYPTSDWRSCCRVPWSHEETERCLHN